MVWVPGGTFLMGSNNHYAEEAPVHPVTIEGFWFDSSPVTNEAFATFVADTGYATLAERPLNADDFPGAPAENLAPGSLVFTMTSGPVDLRHFSQWWTWTPGASWRHPFGSASSLADCADHPVVHVAYEDAEAYANWAGKALPSEAEWERAARGHLQGSTFVWGDQAEAPDQRLANYWHGEFPWRPNDGYGTTSPVGSYPPNGYGLFDMAGNVWEWTTDWYTDSHAEEDDEPCCVPQTPRGGTLEASYDPAQPQFQIPRKVIKGGSFLCADSYCLRYRPSARRPQMIDTGMSHVGLRCLRRA